MLDFLSLEPVGYVLLPLGIVAIIFFSRYTLLALTIFFAPFTATALINVPAINSGIQPGYYFGALFIAKTIFFWAANPSSSISKSRLRGLLPFWLFGLVACLSVLVVPLLAGVEVRRPSGIYEYLSLSQQHYTQLFYLFYILVLLTCIGSLKLKVKDLRQFIWLFLISGVFVAGWGWVQIASFYLPFSYPAWLFNNSLSFHQSYDVAMQGLQRMSSVAPEPSMLARFLLVPTFVSFYCVYRRDTILGFGSALTLSAFFLITILACLSSTAYVGLVGGTILLLLLMSYEQSHSLFSSKGILQRLRVGIAAAVGLGILFFVSLGIARSVLGVSSADVMYLVDVMVLDKLDTASGEVRVEGALEGLQLFLVNPLTGVGWGSNRTFDLVTYILANTGIIGFSLFAWGHFVTAKTSMCRAWWLRRAGENVVSTCFGALALSLGVVVFGKSLSEPDIVYLDHWILIGLLIAAVAALDNDWETRHDRPKYQLHSA